jgi:hypothetical protein
MQDTSAGVCRSTGVVARSLAWLLAVTPLLTASAGCGSEKPAEDVGGLVLNLESDLTMPKDIDELSVVVVTESGETLLNEQYSLGPDAGRYVLPFQVRVNARAAGARVKAQVIARKRGIARMERTANVELPTQRWGAVSLPVNYLCDGTVDEAAGATGGGVASSCGAGQTCDQGRCISNLLPEVSDYTGDAGGGGGGLADLSQNDNCLSVVECMSEGLTVQVDTSTCSFEVPVNASGFINVALKVAQDGFCGPTGCWLPLKFGLGSGWTTNGTTVFLPPAVCFQDPASAQFQVTVSDACQTFWPSLALCGVAAIAEARADAQAAAGAAVASLTACPGPRIRPCPSCGLQTRTCDTATGTWSAWSACSGGGECALGEFTLNACPGGMPQVCGPFCEWIPCCNPATCFGGRCVDGVCCGNGEIEGDETCEGDCSVAADCNDNIACTEDTYTGSPATCDAECTHTPIIADDDGCCAPGVNPSLDNDCQAARCSNGLVEVGESCDGNCAEDAATDCDDGILCTRDTIADLGTCRARCRHTPVRNDMDKCCAPGQTANDDVDCLCGNGAIDPGEFCDGDCPTKIYCNDNNPCTADTLLGSAKDCSARCVNTPIVLAGDNCCAPGQTQDTDPDCPVVKGCDNGVIEEGEICDRDCPTKESCVDLDPLPCVEYVYEGSPTTCDASCTKTIIIKDGDGCCPPLQYGQTDSDCKIGCGNGILDVGTNEQCEPDPSSPRTPTCATDAECKMNSPCLKANPDPERRCATQCVRDDSVPAEECEKPQCGDRYVQADEVCEPHPFDQTHGVCQSDTDCKIEFGPCYVVNLTPTRCTEPCVEDTVSSCGVSSKSTKCGDGNVNGMEMCDPGAALLGKCPSAASECPVRECKTATLNTGDKLCMEPCSYAPTPGCTVAAPPTTPEELCGNGRKDLGEDCDPMGSGAAACPVDPAECDDQNPCTDDGIRASTNPCARICENIEMASCPTDAPAGSGTGTGPECGNGVVAVGEKCDPGASGMDKCPLSIADCNDSDACTTDSLVAAGTCQAECMHVDIVGCRGQMQPAPGGTMAMPVCGDGTKNGMELCDITATDAGKCPVDPDTDCDAPSDDCTVATITGTMCSATCSTVERGSVGGDGFCCPAGSSNAVDPDCAPTEPVAECGNGTREGAEQCDGSPTNSATCVSETCITRTPMCLEDCTSFCMETPVESEACMMMGSMP